MVSSEPMKEAANRGLLLHQHKRKVADEHGNPDQRDPEVERVASHNEIERSRSEASLIYLKPTETLKEGAIMPQWLPGLVGLIGLRGFIGFAFRQGTKVPRIGIIPARRLVKSGHDALHKREFNGDRRVVSPPLDCAGFPPLSWRFQVSALAASHLKLGPLFLGHSQIQSSPRGGASSQGDRRPSSTFP
jgi:hypothetical protein